MHTHADAPHKDPLKKALLWLVVLDYVLLTLFLFLLPNLTLNGGTLISTLLMLYNLLLSVLCFQRTSHQDGYIIYPTLSATLLAFVCFLYFFFLI
ncbi:hypothetical protein A1OO_06255 [Enterovibrio norvegicus FF-33]|uniref:Uncharacterized protein n=1 Tax=Enterovibrio norvegicus FF-454 TaxID=1185651 RepID=A0A1E5BYW3_9GAMM|nr:hypothetical protein [Enterovibrio norvegicus]OEE58433.1 hypothetical protein A1OK_15675 [Enterovibrio norvegicus FF-454]OEE70367.1 hypothetical protein A1OO_06255 [Enterovibrio norvegicus FF-33]OEE77248.1 hypothetical protein A1OQ_22100 [Enterovibrio norvegicus FF-162]